MLMVGLVKEGFQYMRAGVLMVQGVQIYAVIALIRHGIRVFVTCLHYLLFPGTYCYSPVMAVEVHSF